MTDINELSSVRTLRREDSRTWRAVLEPTFRDTFGFKREHLTLLGEIDQLISLLVDELGRHPLPQYVIYSNLPTDGRANATPAADGRLKATPFSLSSSLVAHRAERLVQAAELAAGALSALENGSLQLSAVASRALFEMAVLSVDIHQQLLEPWRPVHGKVSAVRAAANSDDFETFRILWDTRMASRLYSEEDGWPMAKSILGKIDRLNKRLGDARHVYDMLCDATHPNVEANATLWRTDYLSLGDHRAIKFTPGNSNSVVKSYILSAVRLSLMAVIPFARDLWWVAADIANTCNITPNDRTRVLGLPARTHRDKPCSCGSGLDTRLCTHPEPEGITEAELGGLKA